MYSLFLLSAFTNCNKICWIFMRTCLQYRTHYALEENMACWILIRAHVPNNIAKHKPLLARRLLTMFC